MMESVQPEVKTTIKNALDSLDGTFRNVLKFKYGLDETPCLTKKEIARRIQSKTRHIDIFEQKGVRCLRKPEVGKPLVKLLQDSDEIIWNTVSEKISEAGRVVYKSNYELQFEKLPGELLLVLRCVYNQEPLWIYDNAVETEAAWFRSAIDPKIVLEKLEQFQRITKNAEFAALPDVIMEKLEIGREFFELVMALHPGKIEKLGDYIHQAPISSLQLRAMRLHRLLRFEFPPEGASGNDIIQTFNALYQDDQLIGRTLETVLNSYPSFFQVKPGGNIEVAPSSISEEAGEAGGSAYIERPWEKMYAMHILMEIMEEKKFSRRIEIIKLFLERSQHRYQEVTLSAALMEAKEIIRAAPGVLAWKRSPELTGSFRGETDFLLTPKDCKDYVIGRYAGEPMHTYVLWTPAMEYRWCQWARNENAWLFQSLLYIAEPESWPAPDEEKQAWLKRKQLESFYHFEIPLELPVEKKAPLLQDVFLTALEAKSQGAVNWLRINEKLNQKRNYLAAAPILAVLIVLEALLPEENWQKRHRTGPRIDEFIERLEAEIHKKGFVHWDDDTGLYFREQIRSRDRHEPFGWVDAVEIETLQYLLKPGSIQKNIEQLKKKKAKKHPDAKKNSKAKSQKQLSLF